MKLNVLKELLGKHPNSFPRFVLPDGDCIPAHAHVTEIGHVVKNYIDCGGVSGKEEKVVLQTHVGNDIEHRLRSDRFSKILDVGGEVVPNDQLEVEVEYDGGVVAQFPISETRLQGRHLDLLLERGKTQCRARERREDAIEAACCGASAACC